MGRLWVSFTCCCETCPARPDESSALAGAIVATAVAVSAYGLYQVKVELPLIQAEFQRNPRDVLQKLNIEPGTPSEEMLKNRLMPSNEPWSTFALANSLAGFYRRAAGLLLGVALYRHGSARTLRFAMAGHRHGCPSGPGLARLPAPDQEPKCLSRGLRRLAACWPGGRASRRRHACSSLRPFHAAWSSPDWSSPAWLPAGSTRRSSPQSPKSLGYRLEYWQGTWGVITEGPPRSRCALQSPTFWWGVGSRQFRRSVPEIQAARSKRRDRRSPQPVPRSLGHGRYLGFLACLVLALGFAFWNLFGPPGRRPVSKCPTARAAGSSPPRTPIGSRSPAAKSQRNSPTTLRLPALSWLIDLRGRGLGAWSSSAAGSIRSRTTSSLAG